MILRNKQVTNLWNVCLALLWLQGYLNNIQVSLTSNEYKCWQYKATLDVIENSKLNSFKPIFSQDPSLRGKWNLWNVTAIAITVTVLKIRIKNVNSLLHPLVTDSDRLLFLLQKHTNSWYFWQVHFILGDGNFRFDHQIISPKPGFLWLSSP